MGSEKSNHENIITVVLCKEVPETSLITTLKNVPCEGQIQNIFMKNKPLCLVFKYVGQKKHGSLVQNIKKKKLHRNPGE